MSKKKKAQFAIEFVILLSFMFLIFLGFLAVITSKVIESKENEKQKIAEDIATLATNEIELAKSVTNGFSRTFQIPTIVNGNGYAIKVIGNRELVVNYLDKEQIFFLPEKICGDIYMPNNEIDKENDIICVNSNLDYTQCQNAQTLNLCDELDNDFLPGTKCCCCSRYGLCC